MSVTPAVAALIEESLALERAGQIAAAASRALEALEAARAAASAESLAAARTCVGFLRFRSGEYDAARALAEEALQDAPSVSAAAADALLLLGMCATETYDLAGGEECYLRAIALSRQIGYDRALMRGLHNLAAGVYMPRGQFDLALAADAEALQLARERGMAERAWGPLSTMAWIHWLTGQPDRARERAAELAQAAHPGSLGAGYVHLTTGHLDLEQGEAQAAADAFARARAIADDIGSLELGVLVRLGVSRLRRLAGDAAAALSWAADALALSERMGYRHFQGMALIERGRAAWALGETAQAEADLRAAQAVLEPLAANFDLARATLLLASLLYEQRAPDAGRAWLDAVTRIIKGGYTFLLRQEQALAAPLLAAYLEAAEPELCAATKRLQAAFERLPPPPLRIFALGGFRVLRGGVPIPATAWQRRKTRQLLLYLLTRRQRVPRDEVLDALWPELPPDSAALALNTAFSDLRRILEPDLPRGSPSHYLEREGDTLALRLTEGIWYDAWAFEQAARSGMECAPQAQALYRGDFLPEEPYADWALRERERLRTLYLNALMTWLEERVEAGAWHEGVDLARRILDREPWLEEVWRALIHCYIRLGRRSEALQAYHACVRALRAELDVAPSPATRALYEQIK